MLRKLRSLKSTFLIWYLLLYGMVNIYASARVRKPSWTFRWDMDSSLTKSMTFIVIAFIIYSHLLQIVVWYLCRICVHIIVYILLCVLVRHCMKRVIFKWGVAFPPNHIGVYQVPYRDTLAQQTAWNCINIVNV